MKCKDCYNFTHLKCVEDKCLGNCEIDSQNRTVHTEMDCFIEEERGKAHE